ncbi:uncharacterized protein LOC128272708 [Anopheles cruzii]|uniref:uncharacterized protein LOC128272708 n=1 Tax=Anopheles cruzii TaxID=68878 RepID=UPI0022EC7E1F|nr:uncharacterized protein LOC128272708 [Anopheles cruzii]
MASKVILSVGGLLALALLLLVAAVATTVEANALPPEQRSHTDLAELDSSEERPGTIELVKDFFGDLSTKVKEGVQDGVVKVKAGVKQGASKAKEYATNVRDYLRDTFSSSSSSSKEQQPDPTQLNPATPKDTLLDGSH